MDIGGIKMKMKFAAAAVVLLSVLTILTACGKSVQLSGKTTSSPSVQSEQNIDQNQAVNVIKNMIPTDYAKYKISLMNASLEYEGNEYYQFSISNDRSAIKPSIIVSKNNGAILCYYPDSTVTELDSEKVFQF
jgi:uncharacterized protein YpuA (DUF1002 family)